MRDRSIFLVVGMRDILVALTGFVPPLRITETEMTAILAGSGRKEIWTRVVRLE